MINNDGMPSIGRLRYLDTPAAVDRPFGTVVLIHAFPLNARMWEPQCPALASSGWRVVAPQLRGFDGGTGDPPATVIDDYAGDVIDLLDSLHFEDAVIGGLSMGGYVTLAMFRHAPRYFRGMILADTRAEADTPEGVAGRKRMLDLIRDKAAPGVADEMIPKLLGESTRRNRPEVAERVRSLITSSSPEAIAGAVRALMTRPDSTELLPSIHCPTLVLVGAEDTLTPPALSDVLHRGVSGSELAVIPAAGHLSNLEQPGAFNAAVAAFLAHRL
jgi:pimeloyl-ACP methyl ester carboxylesterase